MFIPSVVEFGRGGDLALTWTFEQSAQVLPPSSDRVYRPIRLSQFISVRIPTSRSDGLLHTCKDSLPSRNSGCSRSLVVPSKAFNCVFFFFSIFNKLRCVWSWGLVASPKITSKKKKGFFLLLSDWLQLTPLSDISSQHFPSSSSFPHFPLSPSPSLLLPSSLLPAHPKTWITTRSIG